MKKKKNNSNQLLLLVLIIGLSLLLYPSLADYWNTLTQASAIASYSDQVAVLDNDAYEKLWADARAYNESLLYRPNRYIPTEEQLEEYNSLLDVAGTGIMGYIEIPSIKVNLPIYHGTDSTVLQVAIGHLDWTSLPVGGESTHCVVSGHRGLPSARLFTDLDRLKPGDVFLLNILDETLTYEVDQIRTVLPTEVSDLEIIEGEDLCTLTTCTPYGVNSHRLLIRGHRIDNLVEEAPVRVTADAIIINRLLVAPFILALILLLLLIILLITTRKKKGREDE